MARTKYQDKYDSANYVFQSIKVRPQLLDDFKAACAARGDRVNTVLREAMERYVEETAAVATVDTNGTNDGPVGEIDPAVNKFDVARYRAIDGIWHSPADTNHEVWRYLHDNPAYTATLTAAFDAIEQKRGGLDAKQLCVVIDELIEQVQAHILAESAADGSEQRENSV